jgi:hypothetical protein
MTERELAYLVAEQGEHSTIARGFINPTDTSGHTTE